MSKKHKKNKDEHHDDQQATLSAPVLVADHTDAAHGDLGRAQDNEFNQLVDHNYLSEQEFSQVAETLQRNLATSISLYLKFKKFHWDIRGRMFRDLHLAYDEMAEEVFASIDVLAERLVMLGGSPVAAPVDIDRFTTIRVPTETVRDAREQLSQLVHDHTLLTRSLRDDSKRADEADDPATADIYNGLLHTHDEHRWMLQAILDDDRLN
ncbi:Dps family protein [Deinococcus peraridilitoris]|uniref:DNA-binding ferritin-like protein (Oxidative damage protectant) n=1 Tax=Deinococcus peraridilitoris (strain DSM 19664 / LMG 22246 / CIP 109416 / KR-200) TaxID=937777 RepID=K9ZYW5_DEIPD|nr:Dps family protein [Deinococcus peraridilitoris]AFZ66399.1 DNA-binding ferritin-like protein (oxidative damage protectant) [Deinococcus peraridilitoris DSM 19664]